MLDTILFDLDGTLLPMDIAVFEKEYFKGLSNKFKDEMPFHQFYETIWKATKTMIENTELKTNETVFMEALQAMIGHDKLSTYQSRFMEFYLNDFDKVKQSCGISPTMIQSVQLLKEKGYNLVLATNPLFPRIAVEKRVVWAGLDCNDFSFITSFEESHFCKPQPLFYQEVLENIQKKPHQCLMVGNDTFEDLIAGHLNIPTYLIEDHKIEREHALQATHQGTSGDFFDFVKQLPYCVE